jgi:hypothetical protein
VEQIEKEKSVCALPTTQSDLKELHGGIARAMQYYVSEYKTGISEPGWILTKIEEIHYLCLC